MVARSQTITLDFSNPDLFNPVYIPTFYRKEPFLHYYGSAGSGKSMFVAQKEIIFSYHPWRKKRKTLVARRYYNSLGHSCYAELKNVIESWGLTNDFHFSRSPYSIVNKVTGVEFIFIGLDDVQKVKSIRGIDRGWLEEATDVMRSEDLDQLGTRLRGFSWTQWTLSYNPTDAAHWINQKIHIPRLAGHFILKTTYKDNIRLLEIDPGYADRLEVYKETSPNHYRVYAQGLWGKRLEGLVYPDYEDAAEFPGEPDAYGLDFGFNNPTALCGLKLVDEFGKTKKQLYVEEILYETRHTSNSLVERFNNLNVRKDVPIIADSEDQAMIAALRAAGYWVIDAWKGKGSVKAGIDNIKNRDLRPVGGCKNLFIEVNAYSWKNKNGEWLEEPDKKLDHLMDAMRYGTWYLECPNTSGSEDFDDLY